MSDVTREAEADTANTALLVAAFGLVVVGVAVLVVGGAASWQPASLVVGLGLVMLGVILAFVLGYVEARRAGKGVARSLGRGFLELFAWVTLLP